MGEGGEGAKSRDPVQFIGDVARGSFHAYPVA